MPELSEVEIASRQLRSWLSGRTIVRAKATSSRVIRGQRPQRFASLAGHRFEEVERFGKWMILAFDGGEGLVSHLGMTGKWIRRDAEKPGPSHVRATIDLDDGHAIDYRDPRLFGRLIRGTVEALHKLPAIRELGPDPLPGIDVDRLYENFHRSKRSLKEVLMDQRTLAGLGNIHVSESLHRAKLNPERLGTSLSRDETEILARGIGDSLRFALKQEDSPDPITYVEEGGENHFLVYDRAKKPCFTCGSAILRVVQGGRSTFYCPHCQPRRPSRAATGARQRGAPAAPRKAPQGVKASKRSRAR
ncbi:MAG TPA: bifunctional DNA-formamidopyrimidine glycosylase/DNA-(apurinic or apyrimidinic site) lyase [Myxococcales bacterium]|jgi:formamidopyrimidine-DNA glycosylase